MNPGAKWRLEDDDDDGTTAIDVLKCLRSTYDDLQTPSEAVYGNVDDRSIATPFFEPHDQLVIRNVPSQRRRRTLRRRSHNKEFDHPPYMTLQHVLNGIWRRFCKEAPLFQKKQEWEEILRD